MLVAPSLLLPRPCCHLSLPVPLPAFPVVQQELRQQRRGLGPVSGSGSSTFTLLASLHSSAGAVHHPQAVLGLPGL